MSKTSLYTFFWSLCLISFSFCSHAQLQLPPLISDGMVMQRNMDIKIWGWDTPHQSISMNFLDSLYSTKASADGSWEIALSNLKAGGPYSLKIQGSDTKVLNDVYVGEVWLCSGQSNMELPMRRVSWVYPNEIEESTNAAIRLFKVPQHYDFNQPHKNYSSGNWKGANPNNIMDFSAVAYFFAKSLYEKYHVPIGLINASLGGSPVEAWMSEQALMKFPKAYQEMQKFKDSLLIDSIEAHDRSRSHAWHNLAHQKDKGYSTKNSPWYSPALKTKKWKTMKVPGYWADNDKQVTNGVYWFRKDFNLKEEHAGESGLLLLGRIVDADSVFINGTFVGSTGYQYPPRRYTIPPGIVSKGKNTLTVRIISERGKGGFVSDKPYELSIGNETIDLKGLWHYKLGTTMPPLESQTFVRWKPGGLFNYMIAPLKNFSIKGAIWYQGESNTRDAANYEVLLQTLIKDWRSYWGQGPFPFLVVQLANFMEAHPIPTESDWALLREAQLKSLSLPNTGVIVTIDLGEWNDIHPLNKKSVGDRLSYAAQGIAYGESLIYSGPIFESMKIEKDKAILSFKNASSGLVCKGDELKSFAISGKDKKFVWAHATIENDKVIVWHEDIPNPIAVRYGWADNPDANLYNQEGLPASPFRTDQW